jgi:uncharacterized membrane protein YfhO
MVANRKRAQHQVIAIRHCGAFRGMPVTSGDTSVEMTFRPNRLASSLAVRSVSLLIALFLERALRLQK